MRAHPRRRGLASLLAGFAAVFIAGAGAAQAPLFTRHIDDLPLLVGLAETVGGHAFETAGGRLARVVAEGGATASEVAAAYEPALTALGWRRVAAAPTAGNGALALEFHRAGEQLTITITELGGGRTRAAFNLRPLGAGATPAGEGSFDDGL